MQKDKDGLEEVHNFLERHSPNYFLIILDVRLFLFRLPSTSQSKVNQA